MKATDVMIGDIVSFNGTPIQIVSINLYNGEDSMGGHYYVVSTQQLVPGNLWTDVLEPIPLTKESLQLNGFKPLKMDAGYTNKVTGFDLILHWCENYWVGMRQLRSNLWKIHIQGDSANMDGGVGYVHELQHALKLCGIEKEIVL